MPYQYKRELLSDDEVNPVRNSSGALNPAAEQRGIISNGVNRFTNACDTIEEKFYLSHI